MGLTGHLPPLTAAVILLASLLSGPLVGAVDLSPEESTVALGDGRADVEVVAAPDEGRLDPARYATTGYVLSVPPATVDVSDIAGRPLVVYKLRIPDLSYASVTTHLLDERSTGRRSLPLEKSVLNRTSLPRETYRGELLVVKRVHERDTVLYRGNVTLRVGQ